MGLLLKPGTWNILISGTFWNSPEHQESIIIILEKTIKLNLKNNLEKQVSKQNK